jgi:MFS family permease
LPEAQQRFGVVRVTQLGIALLVFGIVGWSLARQVWELFLLALVSGAGWAATSGAAINSIVAPWFDDDRPKALSLAFNGASMGGLVFTPLWVSLIAELGFATAAAIVGTITVVLLWPLTARYLTPRPHVLGSAHSGARQGSSAQPLSRAELLRSWRFLTISIAFAFGLFAQIGILAHSVTRLTPELGSNGAAWAVSLITGAAVVGRTVLGWMLGNRNPRIAASLNFLVQACGSTLLIIGHAAPTLLVGCVLFGLGVGNLISLPPLIIQREFRELDVGRVVALVTAINQTVFAFAPVALGALRDLQDDYSLPFAVAMLVQIAAALFVLCSRPEPEGVERR